jgi:hypothetical protein
MFIRTVAKAAFSHRSIQWFPAHHWGLAMFLHILFILLALTGAVVWILGAWFVLGPVPRAIISASSVLRCQLKAMRLGKRSPKWHRLPSAFLRQFWEFLGTRPGSLSMTGSNWAWRGVGDWDAHVPTTAVRVGPFAPDSGEEDEEDQDEQKVSAPAKKIKEDNETDHARFTLTDWAQAVSQGETNEGYPAFVVNGCLSAGLSFPKRFSADLDKEEDQLTQKDPKRNTAAFDRDYPRTLWQQEVQAQNTRLGWRVWQLTRDDAKTNHATVA